MTSIGALQANSGLSVITATATSESNGASSTSVAAQAPDQIRPASPNAKASSIGHSALVGALKSQDQYADVFAKATADGIDVANIDPTALQMLKDHLSDMPDLVLAFRSTSQQNAIFDHNRNQSSADMSATLYSNAALQGGDNVHMSDIVGTLTLTAQSLASVGLDDRAAVATADANGISKAFADRTLTIQNAYDVPGLLTQDGEAHYTGPADGLPTGLTSSTAAFDEQKAYGTFDGQNHELYVTSSGSAIYLSWASES